MKRSINCTTALFLCAALSGILKGVTSQRPEKRAGSSAAGRHLAIHHSALSLLAGHVHVV